MRLLIIAGSIALGSLVLHAKEDGTGNSTGKIPASLRDTIPQRLDTIPKRRMDDSLNKYRRDTFNRRDTQGSVLRTL